MKNKRLIIFLLLFNLITTGFYVGYYSNIMLLLSIISNNGILHFIMISAYLISLTVVNLSIIGIVLLIKNKYGKIVLLNLLLTIFWGVFIFLSIALSKNYITDKYSAGVVCGMTVLIILLPILFICLHRAINYSEEINENTRRKQQFLENEQKDLELADQQAKTSYQQMLKEKQEREKLEAEKEKQRRELQEQLQLKEKHKSLINIANLLECVFKKYKETSDSKSFIQDITDWINKHGNEMMYNDVTLYNKIVQLTYNTNINQDLCDNIVKEVNYIKNKYTTE